MDFSMVGMPVGMFGSTMVNMFMMLFFGILNYVPWVIVIILLVKILNELKRR